MEGVGVGPLVSPQGGVAAVALHLGGPVLPGEEEETTFRETFRVFSKDDEGAPKVVQIVSLLLRNVW